MKKQKILAMLITLSMSLSVIPAGYAADGSSDVYFESFDDELAGKIDSEWGNKAPWNVIDTSMDYVSFKESDGLFGRTAEPGDKTLVWTNKNTSDNRFFLIPSRAGYIIPGHGNIIEVSMDFAIAPGEPDTSLEQIKNDSIYISINPWGSTGSEAVRVEFPHKEMMLANVGNGTDKIPVNISLLNDSGENEWHNLKILLMYNDGTSLGDGSGSEGTGSAAVYLDGEIAGETFQFNYSGMHPGDRGYGASGGAPWDNSNLWCVWIRNITHRSNPDDLYIDNMSIRTPDYSSVEDAVAAAETALADNADNYNAIQRAQIQSKLDEAKNILSGRIILTEELAAQKADALLESVENPAQIELPADIGENFDSDIDHGDRFGIHAWNYENDYIEYVPSNGLFGRQAESDDRSLKWRNENLYSNFLVYLPGMQSEDYKNLPLPHGMAVETSFKFAVDTTENPGEMTGEPIRFGINAYRNDNGAVSVTIPQKSGSLATVETNSGDSFTVNKNLNNPDGTPVWHELKFITIFNEGNTLESGGSEGTGRSAVYLDGELLGGMMDFNYSGLSSCPENYPFMAGWDNSNIWNLFIQNWNYPENPDILYLDDVNIHVLDYADLNAAIDEAEEAYNNNSYSDVQKNFLKEKIDRAKSIASGSGDLIPQTLIAAEAEALLKAIEDTDAGNIDETANLPFIVEDFDSDIASDLDWGKAPWSFEHDYHEYVQSNGLFGRVAEPGDRSYMWGNQNQYLNRLIFIPSRIKDMTMPYGTVVETSFKFAVESNPVEGGAINDEIAFMINGEASCGPVIKVSIPHTGRKITSVSTGDGKTVHQVNKSLDDENGNPIWHEISLLTMFNEGESLGEGAGSIGTGRTAVYLDGELLGNTMDFEYSGITTGDRGYAENWDNSGIWNFYIKNLTHYTQPDSLYIDDLSMRAVNNRNTGFTTAINKANTLVENAAVGDDLGQYSQENIDALKLMINKAQAVHTGNDLYPQSVIDEAYYGLTDAIKAFEASAVSQKIDITKTGSTVKAEFTKVAYENTNINAVLVVAIYDDDDILMGIATDGGTGSLIFENAPETKTLSAQVDISQMAGAKTARAFIWNSLAGMSPILPSEEFDLN